MKIIPSSAGFWVNVYDKNFFIPSIILPNVIGENSEFSYIQYRNNNDETFMLKFYKDDSKIRGIWTMNNEKRESLYYDSTIIYIDIEEFLNRNLRKPSYTEIKEEMMKEIKKQEIKHAVFEITGRSDSYILGQLLCECLGQNNVVGVCIKESDIDINFAFKKMQAEKLGCRYSEHAIDDSIQTSSNKFLRLHFLEYEGIKHFNYYFTIVSPQNQSHLNCWTPFSGIDRRKIGEIYREYFSQ